MPVSARSGGADATTQRLGIRCGADARRDDQRELGQAERGDLDDLVRLAGGACGGERAGECAAERVVDRRAAGRQPRSVRPLEYTDDDRVGGERGRWGDDRDLRHDGDRRRPANSNRVAGMTDLLRSPLHDRHVALGAKLADFGGWEMPIEYAASGGGVLKEHAAVRDGSRHLRRVAPGQGHRQRSGRKRVRQLLPVQRPGPHRRRARRSTRCAATRPAASSTT